MAPCAEGLLAEATGTRDVDPLPWGAMPAAMADGHTPEGKAAGRKVLVLSGHYDNHLVLARRVAAEGWDLIRKEVHASQAEDTDQGSGVPQGGRPL